MRNNNNILKTYDFLQLKVKSKLKNKQKSNNGTSNFKASESLGVTETQAIMIQASSKMSELGMLIANSPDQTKYITEKIVDISGLMAILQNLTDPDVTSVKRPLSYADVDDDDGYPD